MRADTLITPHFTAAELGIAECHSWSLESNATQLCLHVLEPVRAHYGVPVRVHSGYRDPRHNLRVGGKPTSWHLFEGTKAAADFSVYGIDTQAVFDWMRLQSKLPFDKVILERDSSGRPACIHVQFDYEQGPRRMAYVGSVGAALDYRQVEVV